MLAALASAAMPSIAVAGARNSEQNNATDEAMGIDLAVVQDNSGALYDVFASDTEAGKKRLARRVHAANTLANAREPGGLGFAMDNVLAFEDGASDRGVTGSTAVLVATHHNGQSRPIDLLTLDDSASVGTAIGAIHRLRPTFLQEGKYPAFSTGQIRAQLTAWIKRLRQAGHIPSSITASWSRILETEGLWSFATCPVHGGFSDGDFLFSDSTITAVTNWQDMQVNDPARDLAWTFAKLDEPHRNAVLTAYGRMLGSRLDDLIMLRANLWLQMEQVGEFIQALNHADNAKIMQFKAQVERLAHQLAVATQSHAAAAPAVRSAHASPGQAPSTITVGTLLSESERRRAALEAAEQERAGESQGGDGTGQMDATGESDRTGSARASRAAAPVDSDSTADRPVQSSRQSKQFGQSRQHSSSATMAIAPSSLQRPQGSNGLAGSDDAFNDDTFDGGSFSPSDTSTIVIPLLEREQRALRDAQEGLDGFDPDDTTSSGVHIYPDRNEYPDYDANARQESGSAPQKSGNAGTVSSGDANGTNLVSGDAQSTDAQSADDTNDTTPKA
ncbi:MAG: phosphotransferase [Bifidobacterium tibiigranuli]|jgi:hypothetical protein|uniref:phosphotransferase n=1 Tax=Bifidobacterium tibiigranuli TaxID=2172043 RepID=UPI0026F1E92C|nr:phosphotransferase [Bifidobacterium tibiigranuli]MCI1673698.1 phosphotransferase [Bifidobacterium tibiigranuli]MCI1712954.1 phosphotransferase [Bifidobacterium tibiigranuli]MCI1833539.1 phosphotransferase [Bifidobacterium tibiigranuli]